MADSRSNGLILGVAAAVVTLMGGLGAGRQDSGKDSRHAAAGAEGRNGAPQGAAASIQYDRIGRQLLAMSRGDTTTWRALARGDTAAFQALERGDTAAFIALGSGDASACLELPRSPVQAPSALERERVSRARARDRLRACLWLSRGDTTAFHFFSRGDTAGLHGFRSVGDTLLGVMIATVPDPVDSHEDWLFDAYLEAIRRAHERRGYVVDRMWLPWSLGADSVVEGALQVRVHEIYPGVLLFRSLADSATARVPRWRIVYLVGEVPTAGAHPGALVRALADRDLLVPRRDIAGVPSDTVVVLGPSFSGSAPGIARELARWMGQTNRVAYVATASATSADVRSIFSTTRGFRFHSTVNSDRALLRALVRTVVPQLGLRAQELAILSEGSTAYGREIQEALARGELKPARPGATEKRPDKAGEFPLGLSFPLNIASLRADARAAPGLDGAGGTTGPTFATELKDPPRPMETPGVTSGLTPDAVNVTLDQISHTLRSHDIRAVAIAASDIRDRIFLVSQLRHRLRDVHFILLQSNQLYLSPRFNPDLRGTVVLSSYPLVPETQLWCTRAVPTSVRRGAAECIRTLSASGSRLGRMVVPFTDEYAEGLYNATLLQLGDSSLTDYTLPNGQVQARWPPVWTSVIGASGFMPLRVEAEPDRYVTVLGATPSPLAVADPRLDFIAGGLVVGLLGLAGWLLLRNVEHARKLALVIASDEANCRCQEESAHARWIEADPLIGKMSLFRRSRWASLQHQEALYRFLTVVAVCGGLFPPATVITVGILQARRTSVAVVAVLILALATIALLGALRYSAMVLFQWRRRHRDDFSLRMALARGAGDMWRVNAVARGAVFLLGCLYLLLTLAYVAEVATQAAIDPVSFTLLFYRAWRVDSGVSPLLPLGLAAAAFLAWCGWHLRRIGALKRMTAFEAACLTDDPEAAMGEPDARIPPPLVGDFSPWKRPLSREVANGVLRVRERLFRLVPLRSGGWVLAALAVACGAMFATRDRTLEFVAGSHAFEALYRFGLTGVMAATSWAVYRLVVVWNALQRALRAIAGTPLITAFERLPQRISRLTRLGFIGVPRSAIVAPIAATQWRHLCRLTEEVDPSLSGSPPGDNTVLHAAVRRYAGAPPPYPGLGTCGDEVSLGTNFRALADVLEVFWDQEPGSDEIDDVCCQVEKDSGVRRSEGPSTSGRFRRTFSNRLGLWVRAAEEFAAVQVVDYVEWVISQLRILAGFLFVSLLLLTLQISAYPFVPESLVKLLLFALLVATIVAVLKVMVEMNRDEVLSRVAKTEPGKVSWDWQFILNALLFGLVPLLTLISSEFPAIRDFLFAWVGPLTRMAGRG